MDLAKYRRLFLDESRGHLEVLNRELLRLEGEGGGVDALFRAAHSVKGMAGSMGYDAIGDLAHALEDVLERLRSKALAATPGLVETLFAAVDALAALVAEVEEHGAPRRDAAGITSRLREAAGAAGGEAVARPADAGAGLAGRQAPRRAATVRVELRVLDELLAVVGELGVARERLEGVGSRVGSDELDAAVETLRALLRRLQETVTSVRMVPLELVTDPLPRFARDLARALGKEVGLEVHAGGVALDRATIEALNDVLIHLVRNAVDHGVEDPVARAAAGKGRRAVIRLRAGRERDCFWVTVEDDGRGMDPGRIAAAAVERGLVTAAAVAAMTGSERLALCCAPGVSTAPSVTGVSGRGVGMDVVKARVDACGGTLRIDSHAGRGTAITVRLPLPPT